MPAERPNPPREPAVFALIGDSNSAVIGRAAIDRKIPFLGGPLGAGASLDAGFFEVRDGGFALTLEDAEPARQRKFSEMMQSRVPILSTLGFNTQRIGVALHVYYRNQGLTYDDLSDAVLVAAIQSFRPGPLAFYRAAVDHGYNVHACYSPQRFPEIYFDLAMRLEALYAAMLTGIGVKLVDVREKTTDDDGRLLEHLVTARENDKTHANVAWGEIVLDAFLEQIGQPHPSDSEVTSA